MTGILIGCLALGAGLLIGWSPDHGFDWLDRRRAARHWNRRRAG